MKLRTISRLVSVMSFAALASACSKEGPDLDQIRHDFDHPSGSITDKSGVMAATGQREASGPALALAGGGVPGQSGLTAAGNDLGALAPLRLHARGLSRLQQRFAATGRSSSALDSLPGEDDYANTCADAPEARAAYERASADLARNISGSSADASAEYSLDVSSCSGGRMTGKLDVTMEIHVEANGANAGKFSFKITESFHDVCEVAGDQRCVNGDFAIEASMASDGMSSGSMEMLAGWELTSSWLEAGARVSAETKGGLREKLAGDGNSGAVQLEYLVYVKNAKGEEVSYVLTISADSMGQATLSYRGADGTLDCQVQADGSGSCSATGANGMQTITWTADEYAAAGR